MRNFQHLIDQCDTDIRAGRLREVRKRLAELTSARVPREFRLPFATLCRRAGLYSLGLLLLRRVVINSKDPATPKETAEYAVLLLRSGAVPEALEMLSDVDTLQAPEALLYRAFGHFLRWEFHPAIPVLTQYLNRPMDPYTALIGRTNLAYAYAYCSWQEKYFEAAERISLENIEMAKIGGHVHLERSCRAILAQTYIQKGELNKAAGALEAIGIEMPLEISNDHFLFGKWLFVLEGLRTKSTAPFEKMRAAALANRDWEALREADFYQLKVKFDTERFWHLYFGSPFDEFRQRCLHEFRREPDRTVYVLGKKNAARFDLNTGEVDGHAALKPGKQSHQLIEVLLRDFYQPLSISGLFSVLFPHEHYDVSSSPGRIHQIIRRARRWIAKAQIPVQIIEENGFYSLRNDGFSFRVPIRRQTVNSNRAYFERLRKEFKTRPSFSAADVQKQLKLPRASVYRLVKEWVEGGLIQQHSENNRTSIYEFASSQKQAA